MKIDFKAGEISFDRQEFEIDVFTLKFIRHLNAIGIRYVLISGYVAIVFGRSRNTEDVDIIVEKMEFEKFASLWESLKDEYECMNAVDPKSAYFEYLENQTPIRFHYRGKFIPNVEFKFPKNRWDQYSLDNKLRLSLNGKPLFISPLEMQIAFKGYLNSEKDIEDARFLYQVFQKHLDNAKLAFFFREFAVKPKDVRKITGDLG
ncbi:MAG: hypothetical protein AABY04_01700 [Candidatus Micrarchaeota archaeon]